MYLIEAVGRLVEPEERRQQHAALKADRRFLAHPQGVGGRR
jgi:hypothetical protein